MEKNEEDEEVRKTIAFDINVLNENGEAIQPEIPEDMPVSEAITLTFKKIVRELSEESTHEKEESIQAFTISDDLTDMETVTAEVGRSDVSIHPEHFTIYGVVLLASGSSSPVTFANGGYPYGKAMSSSAITLAVDIASGTPSTYQWQSSTDKTNWTNMTGAASDTVSFTPASGTWYRCVVNDTESMPVQAVYPGSDGRTWTGNMNSFYITNGYVAYMINGSSFDVTGLYEKAEFHICFRLLIPQTGQ